MRKLEKIWRVAFGRVWLIPRRCARRYTQVYFRVVLPVWTKRYTQVIKRLGQDYPVPPVKNAAN